MNQATFSNDSIEENEVAELLGPRGPLPLFFKNYECRTSQIEMAKVCAHSLSKKCIAIVEAGTGTGKSFAYLLPAILSAAKEQKCIVISTHTVLLQEQLSTFDVPKLIEAFDLNVSVAIAKGMRHYLCIKKLEELEENAILEPKPIAKEIQKAFASLHLNREGKLPKALQTKAHCEKEACSNTSCPHYKACYFFKAKKAYMNAQIIITNHTLLALDAKCREENSAPILPDYDALIVDEAHHLDTAFTKAFASHFSEKVLLSMTAKLSEFDLDEAFTKIADHKVRLALQDDYALRINEIERFEKSAFKLFSRLKERLAPGQPKALSSSTISKTTLNDLKALSDDGTKIALALVSFIDNENLDSIQLEGLINRYAQIIKGLKELSSEMLELFFESENLEDSGALKSLFWIEKTFSHHISISHSLISAEDKLKKLFQSTDSSILTSATLKVGNSFSFFQKALGIIEDETVISKTFESPFDYSKQARLYAVNNLPDPIDPSFIHKAFPFVKSLILLSKGGVFVLFTSKEMLNSFSVLAAADPELSALTILVQGEKDRLELLEDFKNSKAPVLLGTNSFWEGVDAAGAMRLLILMKLPFPSPSDPLFAAQAKQLEDEGKSSFMELSLPKAILRFKQGFGRLVRSEKDRGCIVCLDKRLVSKGYGKRILASLPKAPFKALPEEVVKKEVKEFFGNWSVTESNR